MSGEGYRCWVCTSDALTLAKPSDVTTLTPMDFAISDSHYGRTAAVYRCGVCGFLQCAEMTALVPYYQDLEDSAYLASRPERLLQARHLLQDLERLVARDLRGLRLLDVGAGSGPLVEEALARGLDAVGVEPSTWLCARAAERGLPVHQGVLPHADIQGGFDLVTLIDVIEHTPDPAHLLGEAVRATRPGGVVVLVTPDVASVAARLFGWRWWHFRLAHVGYYSQRTLERLCARVDLEAFRSTRPGWVLPLSYLLERVERYLPAAIRFPRARWMASVAVPFNLRDSIMLCARPVPPSSSQPNRTPGVA